MTDINTLKEVVSDFRLALEKDETLVPRKLTDVLIERQGYEVAEAVTGVRRSGKSKILLCLGRRLIAQGKTVHYLNFEDDRFFPQANDLKDISTLLDLKNAVLLVDEPQNMPNWEKWVRRMQERGVKIYLTGSNSKLLGTELATALGGRKRQHEAFPFSFSEYILAKGLKDMPTDQSVKALDEYLVNGGYPYPTMSGDREILSDYRSDILERDVIRRHNIRDPSTLKDLTRFIMSTPGVYLSEKAVKGVLNTSHVTLRKYLGYLEDAYGVLVLEKFSHSQKERIRNPKKVYPIDNGLLIKRTEKGRLLESAIIQHIRRRTKNIHYWKDAKGGELDVYLPETDQAIQVAYELSTDNLKREESVLSSATAALKAKPMIVYMYSNVASKYPTISAVEFLKDLERSEALSKQDA
jgi:uncharacterized protein